MTVSARFFTPSRLRLAAVCLGVAGLAGTLSACAPLVIGGAMAGSALVVTDRRTSGAQLEDQGIELRATNRLREQMGERGNVSITSYNRQVLLTGEVGSEADKAMVEKTVAGVENVRAIVNELAVLGASSLTQRSADTLTTGRVKAAMVDARDLSANAFKVVTARGTVYLMGRVTQREADRATDITRNTGGVQRVVRVLEIISEEDLARMLPQPAPAPVKDATPSK
jgi:osmotically-inducible protein OsmY